MNPADIPAVLVNLGPSGFIIWWILTTARQAKAEPKADPVNEKLDQIITSLTSMDKRLVKVETIIEERAK
jgi:RAB protein geranylgeranyltransferase component A